MRIYWFTCSKRFIASAPRLTGALENKMKECAIIEVNGQFYIGQITDEVGSRIDYENMAKEDGIKLYRTDGKVPKWADKITDKFNATFINNTEFSLYYAYVWKIADEIIFTGLVTEKC